MSGSLDRRVPILSELVLRSPQAVKLKKNEKNSSLHN